MTPHLATSTWIRRPSWRRIALISAVLVLLPAVAIGAWVGIIQLDGNLRTVEDGVFYRSAQLDAAGFERVIRERGIKSILNLRGRNQGSPWYEAEIEVSQTLGVVHYDVGISARREIALERMDDLVVLVRDAPKPILVHCNAGADRSGLVSALYEIAVRGRPPAEAEGQLSLYYGHFPYLTSKTVAMDRSFRAYAAAKLAN